MSVHVLDGNEPSQSSGSVRSVQTTSRCSLTPKGRLHMDPALRRNLEREANRGARLNATGLFVIERCDGMQSVADLARQLAATWQVPEARAVQDVLTFLESMRQAGLVQVEDDRDMPQA